MPEIERYYRRNGKVVKRHYRRQRPFTVALAGHGPPFLGTRNPRARVPRRWLHEVREQQGYLSDAAVMPMYDPTTIYILDPEPATPEEMAKTLSHETLHLVLTDVGAKQASKLLDRDTPVGVDRMGFGRLYTLPGLRKETRV
jgi:hypothetical protein